MTASRVAALVAGPDYVRFWLDDGRGITVSPFAAGQLREQGIVLGGWVDAVELPPAPGGTTPRIKWQPVTRDYQPHIREN